MEEAEAEQEIEALKAIWPELQYRSPVWNSPSVAIPVYPLGAAGSPDGESWPSVTVVVIYSPRYPKVPPRLELECPRHLTAEEVVELKRVLVVKANEMSATAMVMVHDLLVLTNDFLSEADRAANRARAGAGESLFQKMQTEEQRQKKLREEEERVEERRQRDEEARVLQEEAAKGEAQWALVEEKLGEEKERAARGGILGAMEGVIPEVSIGYSFDGDDDSGVEEDEGGTGHTEGRPRGDEGSTSSDDDDWMNYPEHGHGEVEGAAGVSGVEGTGVVKERSSWYRSQFKELENLGKGGFGTVVKVRNRVDRRLYAVKKVGMDPFDRGNNRKIRREVTTISTLIHKNIVRYYQAWLEGGGGAIPAAVEEEDNSSDDDAAPNGDGDGDGQQDGEVDSRGVAGSGKGGGNGRSEVGQSDTEEDDDDDQSEAEAGLGFFCTPRSSGAASHRLKPGGSKSVVLPASRNLPLGGKGARDESSQAEAFTGGGDGLIARRKHNDDNDPGGDAVSTEAANCIVFGEEDAGAAAATVPGERMGEEVGGERGRTMGRKARRLLRKQERKEKRLLKPGNSAKTTAVAGKGGSAVVGRSESLWAKNAGGVSFGLPSFANETETVPARHGSAACDWSDDDEEDDNEEDKGQGQDGTVNSDGSWGSGGGDYHAHGQGRLVSDAEFFEFCGSPERARLGQGLGAPPLQASWSSEDALMQLYEETRKSRQRTLPKPSSSLPGSPTRTRDNAGTGRFRPLLPPTPPAGSGAVKTAGERQFLYIQMEYCENTLRHLIDHGELWKDEPRCWKIFRQMLEGVDFIHSKGIIHRDLTPPNVFLDGEENVKLGDFGLATSKKARDKTTDVHHNKKKHRGTGASSEEEGEAHGSSRGTWGDADIEGTGAGVGYSSPGDGVSMQSAFHSVFGDLSVSMSDTSQLTDGVGTGPYIAPEQGARFGQYNHKADMWSLGVILFEMLAPRFSTLMERAEVMTALRSGKQATFPREFEDRVPENAKKVIRWLLTIDAEARPTAVELLSSALLPPKLEVEAAFLREALRVMANPESESFQEIVRALMDRETAEHVEHWYDRDPIRTVSAQIPVDAPAVALVCDRLQRVFETHGATPVSPPTIRPKPPPSLAPPPSASKGMLHLLDHKGAVVVLPGNLTAPFARFVARSGVTRLKRYQIDRVFHASPKRSATATATEAWEADFDIVAIGSSVTSSNLAANGKVLASAFPSTVPRTGNIATGEEGGEAGEGAAFEVAEAEAVLVVSQVMGMFEEVFGSWFLRLGNVKMAQAILDLCGVPLDARSTVMALLGKLARGSITPAKARSELEAKASLSAEAWTNVRPLLVHFGKDPFEVLSRLEGLVNRIPAVKSVTGVPNTGRRRELTRKEAVRTKRSLWVFREGCEGLSALLTALGRLGLISLPLDREEETSVGSAAPQNAVGATGTKGGRGSRRRKKGKHQQGEGQRHASSESRTEDRSDGDPRGASSKKGIGAGDAKNISPGFQQGAGVGAAASRLVPRIGGELYAEDWKGGVRPAFVLLDLGLTQRQGNYASGTIFQAVLAEGGSLASVGGKGDRYPHRGERSSISSSSSYSLTVAEGGRYDDLIDRHRYHLRGMSTRGSAAAAVCAVGVRFAVEKMAAILFAPKKEPLLASKQQQHTVGGSVDALVCGGGGLGSQGLRERILVAARLWAAGVRAEYLGSDALVRVGTGRGGGLEGAAEACLSAGIPFIVVVRPHTLVSKRAVKVLSVMERGGGQLEVSLDKLAHHMTEALASLADTTSGLISSSFSSQRNAPGTGGGGHHAYHPNPWAASPASTILTGGAVAVRLALVDRGQTGAGSLDREKMSRQDYKTHSALERRIGSLLEAAITGPERSGSAGEGEGTLVLATEASFAAVRGLTTAYMLHGEGKVLEMLSDHPEKKFLRNLLTALQEQAQEVDGGKRRGGKGQGGPSKGQGRCGGGGPSKGQVFVYSMADEMMDLVTLLSSVGPGLLSHHQGSGSSSKRG